ncbi:MAG: DMT family transporter [Kofleriaceae bacterium]|nr:DMT family transporter [Kofleriaceae bacterium]
MFAGLVMVTLAAASWGTWSLFLRPVGLPSMVTTPIVFVVMALTPLPLVLRAPRATWDRRAITLLLANTGFDLLNLLTFFGAMDQTSVAIAVLTHYVAPILIALAAPTIDRTESPGARPAAVVALAGLVIVLEPWRTPADGAVLGALLGLASAVCYAGNVFCVRRLASSIGAPRAMAYHSLLAAVLTAPFLVGHADVLVAADVAWLSLGAITVGAGSGIVFAVGLLRIGAARAAVLTFAEPIVAVAIGALVWGEPLRPLAAVGGALVLGAGIFVARKARHDVVDAPGDDRDAGLQ